MSSIEQFLQAASFAVAGASQNRAKYGNLIFRKLLESGRVVSPIHPAAERVEDHPAFASLSAMPTVPEAVSIVTPPRVTQQIVAEAIRLGVKHLWMQPGAEHPEASQLAQAAGLNVIDDGSCILVLLAME